MADNPNSELSDEFARLSADLLDQSMSKIRHCVNQLKESQIWWRPDPSMNSVGNLLLHLAGNLTQWGVVPFTLATDRRDRDSEFQNDANCDSNELLARLQQIVNDAKEQWQHLTVGQLRRKIEIQGFDVTHMHAITHAASHFVGHTHQIVSLSRMQLGHGYQFHWSPKEDCGELPI